MVLQKLCPEVLNYAHFSIWGIKNAHLATMEEGGRRKTDRLPSGRPWAAAEGGRGTLPAEVFSRYSFRAWVNNAQLFIGLTHTRYLPAGDNQGGRKN